jgi:hypothetical protein
MTPTPRIAGPSRKRTAPDSGALAGASCAHLVLLELAVGSEGQDPDGVAVGDPGLLELHCGVVGGEFIGEDGQYELPIRHR